jgi:hypothetical protein
VALDLLLRDKLMRENNLHKKKCQLCIRLPALLAVVRTTKHVIIAVKEHAASAQFALELISASNEENKD